MHIRQYHSVYPDVPFPNMQFSLQLNRWSYFACVFLKVMKKASLRADMGTDSESDLQIEPNCAD